MRILLYLLILLSSLSVSAQAPQALNYQAVARDNAGVILANTNLDVRFSVKQTTATGTTVFQETHAASTDALGGFSLEIGRGAASTGSFTAINWAAGPYFLEVELDVNSSGSYTSMGTSEMLSVPYALYAETAGSSSSNCVRIADPSEYTFQSESLDMNGYYSVDYLVDTTIWENMTIAVGSAKYYVNGNYRGLSGVGMLIEVPFARGSVRSVMPGDSVRTIFTIHTEECLVKFEHNAIAQP